MPFAPILLVISGILLALQAPAVPTNTVLQSGLQPVSLELALKNVQAGDIVVLGEEHGTKVQPVQQLQVMRALRAKGLKVSVGMEFFDETQQALVDQWRVGALSEPDFLKAIHWGGFPFDSYRGQAQFADSHEGATTIALNAPMSLTGRIAKVGIAGLTMTEKAMLPPNFALGNARYFERFKEVMGGEGHLPSPEAVQNYFAAQSTWDDVMAFNATQYVKAHQDQVLVIIVGEFHVQYGGGLPDRLKARGTPHVTTFSLVNLHGLSNEEQQQAVEPDSSYGERANFVWTSDFGPEQ